MFELLDKARTLETKYKLLDPALIGNDPLYTTYRPYAICSTLQEEHGKLLSDSDWPALATKLPESNTVESSTEVIVSSLIDNEVQCYKCKKFGHKANNPICPMYQSRQEKTPSSNQKLCPKDPWKYVEPRDLTSPVLVDDKKWYYCTKCKCHATGKLGYYQLSHTDASHDPNYNPEGNSPRFRIRSFPSYPTQTTSR